VLLLDTQKGELAVDSTVKPQDEVMFEEFSTADSKFSHIQRTDSK